MSCSPHEIAADLNGRNLAKALTKLGYSVDRQVGSHIRLTTTQPAEHHITIPDHDPLKIGTPTAFCAMSAKTQN